MIGRVQPGSAQGGFSLLEVLVAFAIMALSLGTLFNVAGGAVRGVSEVEQYQRASLLAGSLLASRESVPASGWSQSGQSGVYAWAVRSAPYPTPVLQAQPASTRLHEVTLEVRWTDGARDRVLGWATLLPQHDEPPAGARR